MNNEWIGKYCGGYGVGSLAWIEMGSSLCTELRDFGEMDK
jgi:hypothetical protein